MQMAASPLASLAPLAHVCTPCVTVRLTDVLSVMPSAGILYPTVHGGVRNYQQGSETPSSHRHIVGCGPHAGRTEPWVGLEPELMGSGAFELGGSQQT